MADPSPPKPQERKTCFLPGLKSAGSPQVEFDEGGNLMNDPRSRWGLIPELECEEFRIGSFPDRVADAALADAIVVHQQVLRR